MTDPLAENIRNAAKKQEKSVQNRIKYNNNKQSMSALHKRWKKIYLQKNELEQLKIKNHPPPPSEESHPVTDPLGKTVD